jgi:TolA-binding protein
VTQSNPVRTLLTRPPVPPSPRTVVIAVAVVVLVVLAGLSGWAWWDAQRRQAQAAHGDVMARVQPALAPDAPAEARKAAMQALESLLERYPSAHTVPEAAYELGNVRFSAGDYAGARAAYELALQRGASGLIRSLARMALARTWEAERDFARAAGAYGALAKDHDPRSFIYEDALLDQARMLELAGKKDEAIEVYQRMLKEIPAARRADDVRSRLASLGTATR